MLMPELSELLTGIAYTIPDLAFAGRGGGDPGRRGGGIVAARAAAGRSAGCADAAGAYKLIKRIVAHEIGPCVNEMHGHAEPFATSGRTP